jgi:hypothetical protein
LEQVGVAEDIGQQVQTHQVTMAAQVATVEVVAEQPTTLVLEALVAQELFIFTTKGNL